MSYHQSFETSSSKYEDPRDKLAIDAKSKKTVILDVGGERFTAMRATLLKFPATRLGKLMRASTIKKILELCDEFTPTDPPEYFFDHNPDNFHSILNMYRTGKFHTTEKGCALVLKRDIQYWEVDELTLQPCCELKYYPLVEVLQSEKAGDMENKRKALEQANEENFGTSRTDQWQSWMWNTIEYPWTSKLAQVLALFSLSMVLLSTLTFIISTAEELQEDVNGIIEYPMVVYVIDIIDNCVIVFFTAEYVVRFIISPNKWKFAKEPMNVIDIVAIIPFFLSLLLEGLNDFDIIGKTGKIIRLIRIMRILRVFKLVRHFAGLKSLFYTLQQAYKELGLLLVLVAVALLTFSSLVYFAERERSKEEGLNCTGWEPDFTEGKWTDAVNHPCYNWSFVDSFWWGLMTICTVGYDLHPKTLLGKMIGAFCALTGVFILTLPIPIVVNSFATFYKNRLWRNEVEHKKKERAALVAAELRETQVNHLNFFW